MPKALKIAAETLKISGGHTEMKRKISVTATITRIDYDKLINHLQEEGTQANKQNPVLANLIKVAALAPMPVISKQIKKIIEEQADTHGISLGVLEIGDSPASLEGMDKHNLYKIVASLDVDFDKLAKTISKSTKKQKGNSGDTLEEILGIVKPFINETMATIPPSAIAKLTKLLVRDNQDEIAEIGATILSLDMISGDE
jgi:hypothetical protein